MIIPGNLRNLGTYVAGNPGGGKSSLISRMALRDIKAGRGVCVMDPTGSVVNRLIHWIPKSRLKDTIWFDTDTPIAIDFFSYNTAAEREVLTDQLLSVFRLDTAPISKPRLHRILGTLFDANQKGGNFTFLNIQDFIESKTFRDRVTDIAVHRRIQWRDMPPLKDFSPILERLTPFYESPTLRTMFGSTGGLKIDDVMNKQKILLINLKDTPSDAFVASLLVVKFQQATFARRYIPEKKRIPFYLYIDECHTIIGYAAKEFEALLTRARQFKLCLILANQLPTDLPPEIQRKLSMIGTVILFALDGENARMFKHHLEPYDVAELIELDPFQAMCKIQRHQLKVIKTPRHLGPSPASYAQIIKNRNTQPSSGRPEENVVESKQHGKPDPDPTHEAKTIPPHGHKT